MAVALPKPPGLEKNALTLKINLCSNADISVFAQALVGSLCMKIDVSYETRDPKQSEDTNHVMLTKKGDTYCSIV